MVDGPMFGVDKLVYWCFLCVAVIFYPIYYLSWPFRACYSLAKHGHVAPLGFEATG